MTLRNTMQQFFDRPIMQAMMSMFAVDMNETTKRKHRRFGYNLPPFVSWHKTYALLPFNLSSGKYVWFDRVWVKIVTNDDNHTITVFSRSEYMAMKLCREVVDGDWCDEKSLT
jgi:hypothetical protein